MNQVPDKIKKQIQLVQRGEITEYYVYLNIAKRIKDKQNKDILEKIALQEKAHYDIWTDFLHAPAKPNKKKIFFYKILNFLLGYTFALKIMERGEDRAKIFYTEISQYVGQASQIALDEDEHEKELIEMLDEDRLNYVGAMVLGLNDALVELSGTLAGLTFALADPKLISLSGLITGIAASLSMAASQYLSEKADNNKNALKSALYTGIAYVITVALLILPYLLIPNPYISLVVMLGTVVFIIFFFNYYISVAKNIPFKKRFIQMSIISLSVAAISFGIGMLIKLVLGISV